MVAGAVWPDSAVLMLAASQGPDEGDGLTVLVRHEPGYVLVTVAGEVDFASAAGLRERLVALAASLAEILLQAAEAGAEAV